MAEARKRVVLMTEGSRGDHQPYVALALALQERYDLLLVVNNGFEEFAKEHGVKNVAHFEFNFREEAGSLMQQMVGVQDPTHMAKMWEPLFHRLFPTRRQEVLDFTKERDIVLISPVVATFAVVAAEKNETPLLMLPLQPNMPTEEWPPIFQDPDHPPPLPEGVTRRDTHIKLFEQFSGPFHDAFNGWRTEIGLPTITLQESIEQMFSMPAICGYSPKLVQHPSDYPPEVRASGYWFLTRHEWAPDGPLRAFLDASDTPPLYIGFGSMHFNDPAGLTRTVMAAAEKAGVRAILCEGWETLRPVEEFDRERFLFVKNVYHPGLLPLCSGAVVHGGAGTTAAAVRAGVPVLVCPFIADQWFWATRVRNAGVGLKGPSAGDITADNLSACIKDLVGDSGMRTRAAALGEAVRAEDSVKPVVDKIEEMLAQAR